MGLLDDKKESHYNRNDDEKQQNGEKEVQELINECRESGSDLSQVLKSAGWEKRPKEENIYHQNINGEQSWEALYNTKYTKTNKDNNSSCEVVICSIPLRPPYLVTDPLNMGTFNYVNPDGSYKGTKGHIEKDVLPYSLWGNNRNDTSDILDRTIGSGNATKVKTFMPKDIGDYALIGLGGVAGYSFMVAQNAWTQSTVSMGIANNIFNSIFRPFPKPSKHFVPDGVFLVCSDGWNKSQLKVTSQSSVKIAGGRLMGTINDRMDCNMNCTKMVIAGAIIGAAVAAIAVVAVVALGICTCGVGLAAAIGAGGAIVGGIGGMLTSFIPCICGYLTQGAPWVPVHTFVKAEDQMVLIETSKLNCFFGGQIQIIYNDKTASEIVDMNKKQMFFDWGNVIIDSVFLSVAAAAGGTNIRNLIKGIGVKEMILESIGSLFFGGFVFAGTEIVKSGEEILFHSQSDRDATIKSHDENLYSLSDSNRGNIDDIGTIGSLFTNIFNESGIEGVKGAFIRGFKPSGLADYGFLGLGVGQTILSFVEDEVMAGEVQDVIDTEDSEKAARADIHVKESDVN